MTWGRWAGIGRQGDRSHFGASVSKGTLGLTLVRYADRQTDKPDWSAGILFLPGFTDRSPAWTFLFMPQLGRQAFYGAIDMWSVSVPLWMPALAASLFMAWRWRRRRRGDGRAFEVVSTGQSGEA